MIYKSTIRIICLGIGILLLQSCASDEDIPLLERIFKEGSVTFKSVIEQKDDYELQVLFTPIKRYKDSIFTKDHFFNYRPGEYFYPASTVKMPVAFLTLQKLEELRQSGFAVDRNMTIRIDSVRPPQIPVTADSTNVDGLPTIAHYIDKVFAVSDNDAYNHLYEFCGSDYINAILRSKGMFTNSRIIHRLGVTGFSYEENKYTPPIHFLDSTGNVVYTQDQFVAQGNHLTIVSNLQKGKSYIDDEGQRIDKPFDFSTKNFINIRDLQETLKRFILPELYAPGQTFRLHAEDRKFLMESMAKLPREHSYLEGHSDTYYDSFAKFFLFGDSKEPIPPHIKIRNKSGMAYGYLTDCAYIQDNQEGIEYFLTATIHVNENNVFNDGDYEYEEIGIPFLAELGRLIHSYMIKNKE